jgi:glycerol kinase
MSLFLALDQSTSATKALLFDVEGRALDREAREHRQHYPQPGWVEHDAEEIWQNSLAVLADVVGRNLARREEIVSLSLTNQRETIVVFDRATGCPLHPALVWQDRRGDALCAEHAAAGHSAEVGCWQKSNILRATDNRIRKRMLAALLEGCRKLEHFL